MYFSFGKIQKSYPRRQFIVVMIEKYCSAKSQIKGKVRHFFVMFQSKTDIKGGNRGGRILTGSLNCSKHQAREIKFVEHYIN